MDINATRQGFGWRPVVALAPDEPTVVEQVAEASLAFHQELLELS